MIDITTFLSEIPLFASTFVIAFVLYFSARTAKLSEEWAFFVAMCASIITVFSLNGLTEIVAGKLISALAGILLAPRVLDWINKEKRDRDV